MMHLGNSFIEGVVNLGFGCCPLISSVEIRILRFPIQSPFEESTIPKLWWLLNTFKQSPTKKTNFQGMFFLSFQVIVTGFLFSFGADDRLSCVILNDFIIILYWTDCMDGITCFRTNVPMSDDLIANDFWIQFLHHAPDGCSLVFHQLLRNFTEIGDLQDQVLPLPTRTWEISTPRFHRVASIPRAS